MARGFLGGIFIGGVFSILVAGIVSFLVPIGAPPQITDAGPDEIKAQEPASAVAVIPEMVDSQPTAEPVVIVEAPREDSVPEVTVEAMTAPLAATETVQVIEAPAQVTESTVPDITADDPVLPNPMALAPMEPQVPDTVVIETRSAAAPVAVAPVADDPVVADPVPVAPPVIADQESTEDASEEALTDMAEPEEVPATDPPAIKTITVEAKEIPAPKVQGRKAYSESASVVPPIGSEVGTKGESGVTVTINRLPTATSDAQTEGVAEPSIRARAVTRYSQPFANAEEKPLMSILLIDQGSDLDGGEVGIAALRSFPYPISFAVDVTLDDAAERMAIYREEGFEVMAMVDLPEGAEPSDAETTLAVAFTRLPEVVGVLEGLGAGLQPNRDVADQVTEILAQGGYGLVSQDKGLNTMPKLAIKEGVPAAPIFRDFDSKGQTPTVIRRFLDQAAFKAGIEGSVIMLGRMRPETISALLVWGLQDRASQVALAPISAVLLNANGE
jgi:polysaccharide deacetylase 2 family uncharacterized protein YibQ